VGPGRKRGWRAFLGALTEAERRDVREILAEDYAAEAELAQELAQDAKRFGKHPELRERLLAIAAREEEHARWLRDAIERLGGKPPSPPPPLPDVGTKWERLILGLDGQKAAYEKLLQDAYALERDHPDLARLLLRISEEEAAHQREIARILARFDRAELERRP
jgi:rubrerythrin